jgi:ATP-dependent 26S proteasome regulatory subunit
LKLKEAIRTLEEKNSQLAHRQAECRDELQSYNEQTSKRHEERDIIVQVIEIISTKAGLIKEYSA